jgi:non-specific serine/threonine protein kinase
LEEAQEDGAVEQRHRDWFLTLAEQAYPELFGQRQQVWLARLEEEHDNLRAALEWSHLDPGGAEAELRFVGALYWFWFRHADWNEAHERMERALARSAAAPPAVLPRALAGATQFAWRRGELAHAVTFGRRGLAVARKLGDREGRAWILCHLGIVAMYRGKYERATRLYDESARLSCGSGNHWLHGMTLLQTGVMMRLRGDAEAATTMHTRGLSILRDVGEQWSIAYALHLLGDAAVSRSEYEQAAECFAESLSLALELRDRWGAQECLEAWARIASATGRHKKAARLFGVAEDLRESLGWRRSPVDQAEHDRRADATRASLGDTAFGTAWDEGRAMTLQQAVDYARSDGA